MPSRAPLRNAARAANPDTLSVAVESLANPAGWREAYDFLENSGTRSLDAVLAGLGHRDWRVRRWCASFLDHHAEARCVPALLKALNDPSADVRRHAVHAIGCQRCKTEALDIDAIAILIDKATSDESINVRRAAAHMIGNQPRDERAIVALRERCTKERDAKWLRNARWAIERQETGNCDACVASGKNSKTMRPGNTKTTRASQLHSTAQ